MWVEFYSVYELCDLHVVQRTFVLWDLIMIIIIINTLALVTSALIDVFLCLLVKQLQLTIFVHMRSEHALLARSEQDVDFVQEIISSNQMKMHRSLYINAVLIQFHEQVVFMTCTQCTWSNDLQSFLKYHFISEHFKKVCYDFSYASTLIVMLMTIVDCSSLHYKVVSRLTLFKVNLCFFKLYK